MKNIFLTLVLTSVIFIGCTSKKNKPEGKILSRKEMVSFLIDLHITDAVLIQEMKNDNRLPEEIRDSVSYYNYLLKKYGINYSDFHRSLEHYMQNPQSLQFIYTQVLDSLQKKQQYWDSVQHVVLKKKNLWPYDLAYKIPNSKTEEDSLPFTIKIDKNGIYELSQDVKIYPDDKTQRLSMMMKVVYSDNSSDSVYMMLYKRDKMFHTYTLRLKTDSTKTPVKLEGFLLRHQNKAIIMHVEGRKIYLYRYGYHETP